MHAYLAAFEALELGEGDGLVELGGGTGYGAALACEVVGPSGRVLSLELEPSLAGRAAAHLASYPQARVLAADAHEIERWRGAQKVYVAFAVDEVPEAWLDALAEGGRLVAPVGGARQTLTLFTKHALGVTRRALEHVAYVRDRTVTARRHPTT
jgi:protein-L-isoaspartate(D-aspartate) O-methyltransferase